MVSSRLGLLPKHMMIEMVGGVEGGLGGGGLWWCDAFRYGITGLIDLAVYGNGSLKVFFL